MIDLTKCSLEPLRADDTFILYRAHRADGARSCLRWSRDTRRYAASRSSKTNMLWLPILTRPAR